MAVRSRTRAAAAPPPRSPGTQKLGRRRPQQERSRAKYDAILDAADKLLADDRAGERATTDPLTTTLVAERADVAVGTLYQYFDGVPAIIEALVERHAERYSTRLRDTLRTRTFERKRDAANAALDALIEYYRREPAFRALWRGSPRATSGGFGDAADALVGIVTESLVAQGLIEHGDEHFALEAQVQWAVAAPLIELAFKRDPNGDDTVLHHLRRLWDLDVLC